MSRLPDNASALLRAHDLPATALEETGLAWPDLMAIRDKYVRDMPRLTNVLNYFAEALRSIDKVYSVRACLKDPDELVADIIRKKKDEPNLEITSNNYNERITDLISLRAQYLFKEDWAAIHEALVTSWDLYDKPTASIRESDPAGVVSFFEEKNCTVVRHPSGYRAVRYVLKSQPAKELFLAELQVRTVLEEGWSEIDRSIRYPNGQDNPVLSQLMGLFERLAAGADEVGAFARNLKDELSRRGREHERMVAELHDRIQSLGISPQEKHDLEQRLNRLNQYAQRSLHVRSPRPSAANSQKSTTSVTPRIGVPAQDGVYSSLSQANIEPELGPTFREEVMGSLDKVLSSSVELSEAASAQEARTRLETEPLRPQPKDTATPQPSEVPHNNGS
jgi:GTP pyrophosphokinase